MVLSGVPICGLGMSIRLGAMFKRRLNEGFEFLKNYKRINVGENKISKLS